MWADQQGSRAAEQEMKLPVLSRRVESEWKLFYTICTRAVQALKQRVLFGLVELTSFHHNFERSRRVLSTRSDNIEIKHLLAYIR